MAEPATTRLLAAQATTSSMGRFARGGGGDDLLNGGLGDDVFVFDAAGSGCVLVEDFRLSDVEEDLIQLLNFGGDGRAFLALAKEEADGLHFDLGHTELMLRGQTLADLGPEMIVA